MALRSIKYVSAGIVLMTAVLGGLVAFGYCFPSQYQAIAKPAGWASEIIVQITPSHPYLAEYQRALVLRKSGIPDRRINLFPDTGGYTRTQLYRLANGTFLVSGFFDAFIIDVGKHSIVACTGALAHGSVYLGAFDNVRDGNSKEWKFIDARQSPEQELVAHAG